MKEDKFITAEELWDFLKNTMKTKSLCNIEFMPITLNNSLVGYKIFTYVNEEESKYNKLREYILNHYNYALELGHYYTNKNHYYYNKNKHTEYFRGYQDMAGEIEEYIERELESNEINDIQEQKRKRYACRWKI